MKASLFTVLALAASLIHANEMPGWSPGNGSAGCFTCGGSNSSIDVATLFSVDLGPSGRNASVGALVLQAATGGASLSTPSRLSFNGFRPPGGTSDLLIIEDHDGVIRQVITDNLFVNIQASSSTAYTVRIMKKAAQGSLDVNGFYTWNTSSTYLIKEFTIDNPDGSSASNRLRIRDVTATTKEWMYTYTATNAGWNIVFPDSLGSVDFSSTKVTASDDFTAIKRFRNPAGTIISQMSQTYTNFSWGTALLQEIEGTNSAARVTKWDYHSTVPFTPTQNLRPVKSVENPDGSWVYYLTYDSAGRVVTELRGIDTGLTTNPSLCLRVEYSYASQHTDDDLSRNPDEPRKVEYFWKGGTDPVSRTYFIYTHTYHKMIQCPNPLNAIGNSANLVTKIDYTTDTTVITKITRPDQTVQVFSYSTDGTTFAQTTTIDEGSLSGGNVTGKRTEMVVSAIGTHLSLKVWDLSAGTAGVLIQNSQWSSIDEFGRPGQRTELGSLTSLMTYACCGLATSTDPDGTVTTYSYDALHRQDLVSKWSITQQKKFDSAGRVVELWRVGTDSSSIRLKAEGYDTAGFVIKQTNALNGVTTIARSKWTGDLDQILTTNPDGGTSLQRFWADGRLERHTGNATAPFRNIYGVTNTSYFGSTLTFQYQAAIKLDAAGADTGEWEISCFDGLDRLVKRILPGSAVYLTAYNNYGQKVKEVDPDGVVRLYRYNAEGKQIISAIDVDIDDYVDNFEGGQSGTDRVNSTHSFYLASGAGGNSRGMDIRVDDAYVWTTASSAATSRVSRVETSTDGLYSWKTVYKDQSTPLTTSSVMAYLTGGARTLTTTSPAGVKSITAFSFGRPTSVTEKDSGNNQFGKVDTQYDAHGRKYQTIDARNGTTTFTYNNADQIATVTTPAPGTGQPAQVTTTSYDISLRIQSVTQPDGGVVYNEYNEMGSLKKTYGSRTYPVAYTFDAQGRMKTMVTWQNFSGTAGAATTTWNYDSARGWLINKRDNDNKGLDYTYTAGGRLVTRQWARTGTGGNRILTTYGYGLSSGSWHGDMTGVTYSYDPQSAPNITYTYDRRGRRATTSSSADAITLSYYDNGVASADTHGSGVLNGYTVTWGYNNYMQLTSIGANTATALSQSFTYDNAGRLNVATDGSYSATHTYSPNSRLVSQILSKQTTTTRLTTTKNWDYLNRLLETKATPSSTSELPTQFRYVYNNANQRVNATLSDGSYWIYQYDGLGQVISGDRFWADGTPVAGQQYDYRFDDIGNRTSAKFGGDAAGQNLQSATYSSTLLNNYSQRTIPAVAPVLGIASAAATVTVNSQSTYRKGEYFWKEYAVNNSSDSVWASLANVAVNGANSTTVNGNEYIPKTPEVYTYDLDGNLTQDGRWAYSWDAENRLVSMVAVTANGPQQKLVFTYDPLGRRIRKQVWNNTAGTGTAAIDYKFIYEGWNLLAEVDALNSGANLRTYLWGNDLSGSRQGAGGVGGLLAIKNSSGVAQFPVFDGNGNVARLVAGDTGAYSATYEYGPFGEAIRVSGAYAPNNPIRFSTKYTDSEAGHVYYGLRYYSPTTGRWLSRDPIEESGGRNLYVFVQNNSVGFFDARGESIFSDVELVFSVEATGDLCTGDVKGTFWIWLGKGHNVTGSVSPDWTIPVGTIKGLFPHLNCRKCASCCGGFNAKDFSHFGQLGGFVDLGKLTQGGILVSKAPCGVQVEVIFLVDILPLIAKAYPPLQATLIVSGFLGLEIKGGVQGNLSVQFCYESGWHLTKGSIGIGGFGEIGFINPFK